MNHFANFIRAARLSKALRPVDLARAMGYRNLSKGASRVMQMEREGRRTPELVAKLIAALGLDPSEAQRLIERDAQEFRERWEQWVMEPVPVQIIRRFIPGIYGRIGDATKNFATGAEWEAYAGEIAQETRSYVCLALDRRRRSWIDPQGHVYKRTEARPEDVSLPYTSL